jgi:hypothetical protein
MGTATTPLRAHLGVTGGGDGVREGPPRLQAERAPAFLQSAPGYQCQGPNAHQGMTPASVTVQYIAFTKDVYVSARLRHGAD